MIGYSVEYILVGLGYGGVFLMMVANGVVSFPSSQVLYIIAGYFVSTGFFDFFIIALVGAVANTIGNIVLYELARKKGEKYITRFFMFPEREVRRVSRAFEKRGAWFLFVGKLLPAIKVFVPIPAGLGKMHRGVFGIITLTTSYLWACGFLAIGYFFGKSADVFGRYAVILGVVTVFVLIGFFRYVRAEETAD